MPQMNTLVLNDGLADHSFTPYSAPNAEGGAVFVESTGIPLGNRRLTVSRTRTQQGREKVAIKMTLPVVQSGTENGITSPRIVRTAYVDCTFSFDAGSDALERSYARFMLKDLLDDEAGQDFGNKVIDNLEHLW